MDGSPQFVQIHSGNNSKFAKLGSCKLSMETAKLEPQGRGHKLSKVKLEKGKLEA